MLPLISASMSYPFVSTRVCLLQAVFPASSVPAAPQFIPQLQFELAEAQDNLLAAKARQAVQANNHCSAEDVYALGDLVLIYSCDRWHLSKLGMETLCRAHAPIPRSLWGA